MELRKPVEPALATWLRDEVGGLVVDSMQSELGMLMTVTARNTRRGDTAAVPDDVLTAWHRELARQRHVVGHAEAAFVKQARRSGWPDSRIATVLGLDDDVEVQDHLDSLEAALTRTHPSQRPAPWTG